MKKLIAILLCLATFAGLVSCSKSGSQSESGSSADVYPNKPLEVTVQWNAGGGADLVFRALAEVFPKYANGQPMVIKNVGGASGVTGSTEFMRAASDGYKVMHINTAHMSKIHMSKVPYEASSFTPLMQVVDSPNYILVAADAPWNTMEEFVEAAKAAPGSLSIGNTGVGGGNHLAALIFEDASGTSFNHIAYDGGGPAVIGLLSSEINALMANSPEGMANVDAGQAKVLVSFGSKPMVSYPDVPLAMNSAGFENCIIEQWRGMVVPVGTSEENMKALHDIIKQCIEDPAYIESMKALGAEASYKSIEDFTSFVQSENDRFELLIKTRGLGDRYTK